MFIRNYKVLQLLMFLIIISFIGLWIFSNINTQESGDVLGIGSGTLYYIDYTLGSDSNNGTSTGTPWKTLSKVTSSTLAPGDIVHLKRGETWNDKLEIAENGTSSDPIVIRAYGTGNKPIVSNTLIDDGAGRYRAIFLTGDYIIVEDIKVTNTVYSAIETFEGADNNTVQNVEIDNSGVGVRVKGSYTTISNNYIHDLKMVKDDAEPNNDYGALGISIEGSNINVNSTLIERNVFINCKAPSNDYTTDGGAIEIFGDISNTTIRYNYTQDNKGFTEVGGPSDGADRTVLNTYIHHNVMKDNYGVLVLFNGSANSFRANVTNFRIENNTIFESARAVSPIFFQGDVPIANQFFFINNFIYAGAATVDSGFGGNFTHHHNVYKRWNGSQVGYSLGTGEIQLSDGSYPNINTIFMDSANGDFRPSSTSPLIDIGSDLSFTEDYNGTSIPQGATPDIGAYEYIDDDSLLADITVTETSATTVVVEGGATDTIQIKLNHLPSHNVTVSLTESEQISIDTNELIFTSSNWDQDQTVTITAVNDNSIEGTHSGIIGIATNSSDTTYVDKIGPIITANITDNDTAGITITETSSSTTVTEGGATDTLNVKLTSIPTNDVTINMSTGADITVNPTSLIFTDANWDQDQAVTVTAVDDVITEGSHSDTISFTSTSGDSDYSATIDEDINVNVTDNESVCTSFTYSSWSACVEGSRERTIVSSSPVSCTGGSPVLVEACSTQGIVCGTIDTNADNQITFLDFGKFVRVYGKRCMDQDSGSLCGSKDADNNGKVDFNDFETFISRYNKASCAI